MDSGASGTPLITADVPASKATALPPVAPTTRAPFPAAETAREHVANALQILLGHPVWLDTKGAPRSMRFQRDDVERVVGRLQLALEQLDREHRDRREVLGMLADSDTERLGDTCPGCGAAHRPSVGCDGDELARYAL